MTTNESEEMPTSYIIQYRDLYRTPLGDSTPCESKTVPPCVVARFMRKLESLCATNHVRFDALRATRRTVLDGRVARVYASRIEVYPMSAEELVGNLAY